MARDPSTESHIAESKAKIEKAAPEAAEAERHIDRTRQALERSRILLMASRDPLALGTPAGDSAGAARAQPAPPRQKRGARKPKAKRPR